MNAIIRHGSILGLLITAGCVTPRQPAAFGRWTVSGTDDVVTLARHHSARLTSGGKTVSGSYRMVAHDLLVVTLADEVSPSKPRTVAYLISPGGWSSKTLERFADNRSEMPPVSK